MRVSLCVLSGSRRGEYVELDADEFRVGGEPSCDVYFRPESDAAARGVCLRLHRDDAGWRISPASGRGSLVNQQVLEATLPIRSGDIVRLSPDGPDFRFSLVEVVANGHPGSRPPHEERPPGRNAAAATASRQSPRFSLSAAALIVAAAALVLVIVALSSHHDGVPSQPPKQPEVGQATPPPATPLGKPATVTPTTVQNPLADSSRPSTSNVAASSPSPPPMENKAAPRVAEDRTPAPPVDAAREPPTLPASSSPLVVLAIESKDQKQLQPFAVACAVEQDGREVLLTTGRIARIMALFPQQYYAIVPRGAATSPVVVKLKPGQIFMHRLYVDNVEPEVRDAAQYFDVGALLAADKFPSGTACRVASRAKVEAIRPGSPLQCWTIEKPPDVAIAGGAILDRQLQWTARRQPVQLSRTLLLWKENDEDPSAADRRLFELDGPDEPFLEGSPLLNSQGELVALYSKTPVAADVQKQKTTAAAGKQQPRAALVDAEMVAALWTGKPSVMWVGYHAENRRPTPTGAGGK